MRMTGTACLSGCPLCVKVLVDILDEVCTHEHQQESNAIVRVVFVYLEVHDVTGVSCIQKHKEHADDGHASEVAASPADTEPEGFRTLASTQGHDCAQVIRAQDHVQHACNDAATHGTYLNQRRQHGLINHTAQPSLPRTDLKP